MRLSGYALSELLVTVAIAGLIISTLTFLNVDYVGLVRRMGDVQTPFAVGGRAETDANLDRCSEPGGVLSASGDQLVELGLPDGYGNQTSTPVLTVVPGRAATELVTGRGPAGASTQPIRIVIDGAGARRGSMASVEIGEATVGVVSPRCDLRQVCQYDPANAMCKEDEVNSVAAGNAIDAGNALAQPG